MISERSCDTEDWSNDHVITGINYIFRYVYSKRKQSFLIAIT